MIALAAVFAAVVSLSPNASVSRLVQPDRIWIAPAPGSLDYVALFSHPEQWPRAHALTTVFKLYQQHTQMPPAQVVGPNNYDALARAGVFRTLNQWNIKTALEVGAVKESYCTADASGMATSIANTIASVNAVRAAGGTVYYLSMDEPFVAGQSKQCGGPGMEPTADRLQTYINAVKGAYPLVRIGLIDAYPYFTPDAFASMLELTRQRGVLPAFLHVDVDRLAVRAPRNDFPADMKRLQQICRQYAIPFGIIIWGYNGDADALFAKDAEALADAFREAFPTWETMPTQLIVQSWSQSSTGLNITPTNLPEDQPYTLTNILWRTFRRYRGEMSATTGGQAIPRK